MIVAVFVAKIGTFYHRFCHALQHFCFLLKITGIVILSHFKGSYVLTVWNGKNQHGSSHIGMF